MDRLNQLLNPGIFGELSGMQRQTQMGDTPQVDNSEIIYISPLSVLKVYPNGQISMFLLLLDAQACSRRGTNGSHGLNVG